MFYEFETKDGKKRLVQCGISKLPELVERMKREGWRRLYSLPTTVIRPGFGEAMEESLAEERAEAVRMAKDREEAQRDLAQAVREELQ